MIFRAPFHISHSDSTSGVTGLNAECMLQMLVREFLFLAPLVHLGQKKKEILGLKLF